MSSDTFSLGLTYWQRSSGFLMWQRYDRGAVREELAHVAALGCDTLRLCLSWEDFQPEAERIGSPAMRALEQALDAARDAGLRVVAALFPVSLGGVLQVPRWANGPDVLGALRRRGRGLLVIRPPGVVPVLAGGRYRPVQTGDLFSEPSVLEAQRFLAREVAGYFAQHPALWAWQLGEGFELAHRPESPEAAARWYRALADELHGPAPHTPLLGVTSLRALTRRSGPRPEGIAGVCELLGVAAEPPELLREGQRRHTSPTAFAHALAAGLAGARTIVTAVGMPVAAEVAPGWHGDEAYGRRSEIYFGTAEEQGSFVEAALDRLYRAGARGVWLSAYADHPQELWSLPPLDRSRRARTQGVVDAAGREKPAAAALRDAARRLREAGGAQPHPAPAAIDAERYWHDPERSIVELWHEFEAA